MEGRTRAGVALATGCLGVIMWWWFPSPWPQLAGLPLVLIAFFLGLVPLPGPALRWVELIRRSPVASWGLPLALIVCCVGLAYSPMLDGHMPWAVGQADHPTHQYQAWLLVERMLPSGRLFGWSDMRWAGYPALELYPIGGPLWVALWRALTFGALDWEATYALAVVAMIAANVAATYVATRRLSGPFAALIAAALVLFERGSARQGGDYYAVDVGVWPVTMGIGPLLLCLERLWSWIDGKTNDRGLAFACLLAGWALLCHPMYLPVLVLAGPCIMAVALTRRVASDRAAMGIVATLLLGFMIAAFWYLPFLAHSAYSEPGGAPFRSLTNIGETLAMASYLPHFWTPALVLGVVGVVLAVGRGGGIAALAVLAVVLVLASSSTPLELTESLTGLSASVQQERFMIPLRVLLCILGGHGVAVIIGVSAGRFERWRPLRGRLAVVGLILVATPIVAPALEGLVKHLVVPVVEFEHGEDMQHRRDLLAMCRWLRSQVGEIGDDDIAPRTAWYVGFGHHEYNNAPIYCGLAQIIESPAETYASRPGGISERELRAFGARWVIGDRPIEGRDDYLQLVRRFGDLHVYELSRFSPQDRVTVLNQGRAHIELFSDELVRVRIEGAGSESRVVLHVARFPPWVATMNGQPVPIGGGHLGLPRADLNHVSVTDGVLELRYRRGVEYVIGALCTLLAALILGLIGVFVRVPALQTRMTRQRLVMMIGRLRPSTRAVLVCGLCIVALAALLLSGGGSERQTAAERPAAPPELPRLADVLHEAQAWIVEDGERRPMQRRWDGRFGAHLPPVILVDRHVEALDLGDPRRVVAARVIGDEEVHIRFQGDAVAGVRGLRGAFARGGRGREETHLEVWLGHRRIGRFTHDRLGEWNAFEAVVDAPAQPLELVIRGSGRPGRAVLIDAGLVR